MDNGEVKKDAQGGIPGAIERLSIARENLFSDLAELKDHLDSVMDQSEPTNGEKAQDAGYPTKSRVGDSVYSEAMRIEAARREIRDIIKRIDI